MINNLLKLTALAAMPLVMAQSNRFVYAVSMKVDSTNRGDVKKEIAYLDTDGSKSLFIAEKTVQRDSLFGRSRQTGQRPDFSQMENLRSTMNYTVEKDYGKGEVTYKNRLGRDNYAYTETINLPWAISPETMKVDKYTAQKATVDFGGRKWTAWFAPEIPVSDGPYKFDGLPGLIVKLSDDKEDYKFELAESKKIPAMAAVNQMGQTVKTKKSEYLKVEKRFKQDPEEFMRSSMSSGGGRPQPPTSMGSGGPGGGAPSGMNQERMRGMRDRMLQEVKSNNNPIELK